MRESARWTVVWCMVALAFNALTWYWRGSDIAIQFLTGYLVEWSLSMDNVFVFAVIFRFFGVPLKHQYRVLYWGIIGAILLRVAFIAVGAAVLNQFDWILWLLGALLIYTGIKLAFQSADEFDPSQNRLMRLAKRFFPVAQQDHGQRFVVTENGRRAITPLFLVLLVIASTDVVFAVDSVPAIFGITKDPFTICTSNIFAVLGLRALYFLLAAVMNLFRYLNYGLSAVLVFVGAKMVAQYWLADFFLGPLPANATPEQIGEHHLIGHVTSLLVILSLLGLSIIASIVAQRRWPNEPE